MAEGAAAPPFGYALRLVAARWDILAARGIDSDDVDILRSICAGGRGGFSSVHPSLGDFLPCVRSTYCRPKWSALDRDTSTSEYPPSTDILAATSRSIADLRYGTYACAPSDARNGAPLPDNDRAPRPCPPERPGSRMWTSSVGTAHPRALSTVPCLCHAADRPACMLASASVKAGIRAGSSRGSIRGFANDADGRDARMIAQLQKSKTCYKIEHGAQ
ncbi:hypothetical protein C8J57DRAFT_1243839 [Mycena rebaudengoi]|nr:hypothetical protein C8J57DRAFT_1243839 [Mycena rebaudengoi]